jgi:four helix bundle protein
MSNYENLEDRTLNFAKKIIHLCAKLPKNTINIELTKQIIRSGGSIGANYREANESLSKKDFNLRLRISRKEAKETSYWLELILEANQSLEKEVLDLLGEVREIRNILSAIICKASSGK